MARAKDSGEHNGLGRPNDDEESDGYTAGDAEEGEETSKSKIRKRVRAKLRSSNGETKRETKDELRDKQHPVVKLGDSQSSTDRPSKESLNNAGAERLKERHEGSLTYLNLTRCLRLSEKIIKHITKRGTSLQTLILSGASDCVTDRYSEPLRNSSTSIS